MKYDVVIMSNGLIVASVKDVSFIVAIAMLVGFKRKNHPEGITITISNAENESE